MISRFTWAASLFSSTDSELNYVANVTYVPGDPSRVPPRSWAAGSTPTEGERGHSHWDQLCLLPPIRASSSLLLCHALGRFHPATQT